jgi:Family of unknown function (DUF5999)
VLCNGVVLFEDTGELLPDGSVVPPRRPATSARLRRPGPSMSERAVGSGTARWAPRQALADTGRTNHECRDGKTRGGMIAVDFIEIEALRLRCVLGGVRVCKPGALRFADSVGVLIERAADDFADSPQERACAATA